ncbi:YidC/Oxa1 family membrane protein insertase [Patescibacteria group bacterium AH-259-L05]|nr:YidC/Oxa1 family membrane protein insertase [Patescibacteria group bacterium AH-259-L05]
MIEFFRVILYQPLLNLLVVFYNIIPGHDLGVAIIFLTIAIKLLLSPLSRQGIKAQKSLQEVQPQLEKIKKKHAHDKEKQTKAIMSFYKENKVNPFSSCLPLLIQLPILIAVFQVFRVGLTDTALDVYSFIHNPGVLKVVAFGFLNLAEPSVVLAALTAVFQYFQIKLLPTHKPDKKFAQKAGAKDESMMSAMNKQMKFMMPAFTLFIGMTLPSGLMLYWVASLIISIIEQKIILTSSQS